MGIMHGAIRWRRVACSGLLGLLSLICACDPSAGGGQTRQRAAQGGQTSGPSQAGLDSATTSLRNPQIRRMVVEFAVLQFSMPKGTFTDEPAFWKLCSGEIDSAPEALRLRDNGFQVVVGTAADRQGLDEFLDSVSDRRSSLNQLLPDETRWVEIDLPPCEPYLSVFLYDSEGNLHGERFRDAHPRLKFRYEVRSTNLKEIHLEVLPELEEPPGLPEWQMTPDGPQQVQPRRFRSFQELLFTAKIPEGGFLLLGSVKEMYETPLVGRAFFMDAGTPADAPRESIFIISPVIRMYGQDTGS